MILPSRSEFDFIKKPLSFLIVHYKQNKEEKGRGFERYEIIFQKLRLDQERLEFLSRETSHFNTRSMSSVS